MRRFPQTAPEFEELLTVEFEAEGFEVFRYEGDVLARIPHVTVDLPIRAVSVNITRVAAELERRLS